MLTLGTTTRVFVAVEPVDMRGSFDALAGHVRRLHGDPLDGYLYLFLSRSRRLLGALWFDRTGWAIFAKRLERAAAGACSGATSRRPRCSPRWARWSTDGDTSSRLHKSDWHGR